MGYGMQWHQPDHMQTSCTSLQTDNHTNILNFYRPDDLPDAKPRAFSALALLGGLSPAKMTRHIIQQNTLMEIGRTKITADLVELVCFDKCLSSLTGEGGIPWVLLESRLIHLNCSVRLQTHKPPHICSNMPHQ